MSGLNVGHVGIAGEVRCVIKREDGSVKEDTGFQKNLILNQGLDFFGGQKGATMFEGCAIGSGNSNPLITQTQLDSFLTIATGVEHSSKYDYAPDSSNLYKTNKVFKYTFSGLSNVNIGEVGLVSQGTTSANYYLCTRALLKDISGSPTTITILSGEVLEVYYKLWNVITTLDTTTTVNMLNGKGGSVPYNVVFRPSLVGTSFLGQYLGTALALSGDSLRPSASELASITSELGGTTSGGVNTLLESYLSGSYKRVATMYVSVSGANYNIRSMTVARWFLSQLRFGSVVGDNPIPKTNLQTLSIPIEFSWGRYEGAL